MVAVTSSARGPAHDLVRIESITPRVAVNTAGASVGFAICTAVPTGMIGAVNQPIDRYCTAVTPAAGHTLDLGSASPEMLVVTMGPSQAGRVRVVGADVTYQHGAQDGTDHLRFNAVATAHD